MPLFEKVYELERAGRLKTRCAYYSATPFVLAPSVTQAIAIPINQDSHFLARWVNIAVFEAATVFAVTLAPILIQLTDTTTRNLLDNPQPIQNICGGAANQFGGSGGLLPGTFPEPWLLIAGGSCIVTLQNLSAARTFTRIDVTFGGDKLLNPEGNNAADLRLIY